PGEIYGDERSGPKAGWCRIRHVDLSLFSPVAESAPLFIQEEFLRVDQVSEMEGSALLNDLREDVNKGAPLIYVHGYYISFEKGCRRAVLFQENADLAGRLLWFSWPSDGALTNYTHDEADLYWSVPDLAKAIVEMESRFGDGVVNVVGHSLGARGVVLALKEVSYRHPDVRLGEIVLLAPDIDFAIFQRMLPDISPIAENITIYVTSGDRPLALSAQLHGYPRLGEAGNDVSTIADVEVIDLSDLPVESPTGHLYHIYSKQVGDDLSQLLNDGKHAAERRNLLRTGSNTWSMKKDQAAMPD
ncbi:MAG: alpha/beta hydrolase, partial [Gammaproteobacteria bacterium]|nr:alpha/beta hydrolase [Gammaproteobacteria bacterium]